MVLPVTIELDKVIVITLLWATCILNSAVSFGSQQQSWCEK